VSYKTAQDESLHISIYTVSWK